MKRELYPHQSVALDLLRQSLASGKTRPVLQAPTGFGKTVLAGAIIDGALRKGKRVIFTVPALSLIDQAVHSFWAEGFHDIGVLQGDHPLTNPSMPVQVASVQTLQRRHIPRADLVMVDECHRWFEFYGEWMSDAEWTRVPFVGLSATPWTKGLGKHYDDLLIAATTQNLIDRGFLSSFRVFAPSHPDLSNVRTVAGDYHEGDIADAMQVGTLVADAVSTWLAKAEGRPTLLFAVNCAHAQLLQEQFIEAGVRTEYIDAHTTREEREIIKVKFHNGEAQVVCNVGCLTTGIDWDVRCLSLCRPTKSEMLYVQIIGRGLRTAEGKADCLILDHSDSTLRLGFVTDIHREALDDGKPKSAAKRKAEKPLPKECPSCGVLKAVKVRTCPSCGFTPVIASDLRHGDGELVEWSPDGGTKPAAADRDTKQRWFSMLSSLAEERGYKSGWIAHTYRKKFGVWPQGLSGEPIFPDRECRAYVRHLMIKHAKSQKVAA